MNKFMGKRTLCMKSCTMYNYNTHACDAALQWFIRKGNILEGDSIGHCEKKVCTNMCLILNS
jgi:hypothetical protein